MKKKLSALFVSAVMALCVFTGCGNEIQGHEPSSAVSSDSSSQPEETKQSEGIVPLYDSSAKKVDVDNIDYLKADNMKYYFERLVVGGDSIAYGWQYYGLLPRERVVAQGGLSTFGFSVWEQFETTGVQTDMKTALKKTDPILFYVCLGMNDVNIRDKETFAKQYKELLQNLKKLLPNCLIVVQSITPVAKTNQYKQVTNAAVKAYNTKLREVIAEVGREDIIYFNAYSSLLGDDGWMDPKYDGGDGLHINTEAYKKLLEDLSKRLNSELAKQRLEIYEQQRSESAK